MYRCAGWWEFQHHIHKLLFDSFSPFSHWLLLHTEDAVGSSVLGVPEMSSLPLSTREQGLPVCIKRRFSAPFHGLAAVLFTGVPTAQIKAAPGTGN